MIISRVISEFDTFPKTRSMTHPRPCRVARPSMWQSALSMATHGDRRTTEAWKGSGGGGHFCPLMPHRLHGGETLKPIGFIPTGPLKCPGQSGCRCPWPA